MSHNDRVIKVFVDILVEKVAFFDTDFIMPCPGSCQKIPMSLALMLTGSVAGMQVSD